MSDNNTNYVTMNRKSRDRSYNIIVEGVTGSGKTTFTRLLNEKLNNAGIYTSYLKEPLDQWIDFKGDNVFDLLAVDLKRWAFTFQLLAMMTFNANHSMDIDKNSIRIMERSVFSGLYIFMELHRLKGNVKKFEYNLYEEIFKKYNEDVVIDLIIYLRCEPEISYKRVKIRNRESEEWMDQQYLTDMFDRYEDWLMRKKFPVNSKLLIVDISKPIDELDSDFENIIDELKKIQEE